MVEDQTNIFDNSKDDINLSWNKIVRANTKVGFRDGANDGREQNFQEYFDMGYKNGFTTAFVMGKYKGSLKVKSVDEELLQESRKGWCCLCKDNNLLEKTIQEIKKVQGKVSEDLLNELHLKYSTTVDITLPNKIHLE